LILFLLWRLSGNALALTVVVRIDNDGVFFGFGVPFARFEGLAKEFAQKNPKTLEVEASGRRLLAARFPEADIGYFVRAVSAWGGYEGIAGRILRRNSTLQLRTAFQEASSQITSEIPNVPAALAALNKLSGLGTPSFASKHLRFLFPEYCPVFDSILQEALPYSFDPRGYGEFARDCCTLAKELSQRAIISPWPERNRVWVAADAEAALYTYVLEISENEG